MALTLGTDAYDTLANVRAYWAARGETAWASASDANAEIWIRKGTDWIERNFRFIGTPATTTQRLHFPATDVYDTHGRALTDDYPWQVQEATAIVADLFRQGTYDLEGIVTDDAAAVTMTKVDVITVQYDASKRLNGQDVPSHVYQLLRPLTLQNKLVRA